MCFTVFLRVFWQIGIRVHYAAPPPTRLRHRNAHFCKIINSRLGCHFIASAQGAPPAVAHAIALEQSNFYETLQED